MNKDNIYYEKMYTKHIEPLYGKKRDNDYDDKLLNTNEYPHNYSILNRTDLTNIETYSIDPDGCEDADDAFSIFYNENDELVLIVHIADPTEYININSTLWNETENGIVTRYPSNRKPIHMLPDEIMEKASLMDNRYGCIKNAISIKTLIDKNNYKPIGDIEILFSKIKLNETNGFTYKEASEKKDNITALKIGLLISKKLNNLRSKKTVGTQLSSMLISNIRYTNEDVYLEYDTIYEKKMKNMIEEFAIFANTFIGNYLKIHLDGEGIFRTCNTKDLLDNDKNQNADELLHNIIVNGIRADYMETADSHDLVGSDEYTHFTSPIRRSSDCISHYLIKYIYLRSNGINIDRPFNYNKLASLSNKCFIKTRDIKKVQYKDNKFRLIQVINNMLHKCNNINGIKIEFYITSYVAGFLNLIINKIDIFKVYLSYTLRTENYMYDNDNKKIYTLQITKVNCPKKFDEGSIPELDNFLFTHKQN